MSTPPRLRLRIKGNPWLAGLLAAILLLAAACCATRPDATGEIPPRAAAPTTVVEGDAEPAPVPDTEARILSTFTLTDVCGELFPGKNAEPGETADGDPACIFPGDGVARHQISFQALCAGDTLNDVSGFWPGSEARFDPRDNRWYCARDGVRHYITRAQMNKICVVYHGAGSTSDHLGADIYKCTDGANIPKANLQKYCDAIHPGEGTVPRRIEGRGWACVLA